MCGLTTPSPMTSVRQLATYVRTCALASWWNYYLVFSSACDLCQKIKRINSTYVNVWKLIVLLVANSILKVLFYLWLFSVQRCVEARVQAICFCMVTETYFCKHKAIGSNFPILLPGLGLLTQNWLCFHIFHKCYIIFRVYLWAARGTDFIAWMLGQIKYSFSLGPIND